ncbi:hypothetical protein Tco_1400600 [Tanacetum coccineum]
MPLRAIGRVGTKFTWCGGQVGWSRDQGVAMVTKESYEGSMVRCKVLVKGAVYQGGDKVQLGVQVCLSSLQALSDLNYLFGGFMDYLSSRELDISNLGPADRLLLVAGPLFLQFPSLDDPHLLQSMTLDSTRSLCDAGCIS